MFDTRQITDRENTQKSARRDIAGDAQKKDDLRRLSTMTPPFFVRLPAATRLTGCVEVFGKGLHSGIQARLLVMPGRPGTGIRFFRQDTGREIRATAASARPSALQTILSAETTMATPSPGACIATPEHLMAAFALLGIQDAKILASSEEIPILDGSAAPWIAALRRAGIARSTSSTATSFSPASSVTIRDGDAAITIEPANHTSPGLRGPVLDLSLSIDFPDQAIGRDAIRVVFVTDAAHDAVSDAVSDALLESIANARTFTQRRDLACLRAAGLARGGGLDCAVVSDGASIVNPEGLRHPREFIFHKTLDLLGDLRLLGGWMNARVTAIRPSHALTVKAMQEVGRQR